VRHNTLLLTITWLIAGLLLILAAATYLLRFPFERASQEEAVQQLLLHVEKPITKVFSPQDLQAPVTGQRYQEADTLIKDYILSSDIARLRVYTPLGLLVYSTAPEEIGTTRAVNNNFAVAAKGETTWEVQKESEIPLINAQGPYLELYTPLAWNGDGSPQAVLELYQYHSAYAAEVARERNLIVGLAALLGLLLVGAFAVAYAVSWRSVRRARDRAVQRRREVEALNALLRKDLERSAELRERILELQRESADDSEDGSSPDVVTRYVRLTRRVGELTSFVHGE